MDKKELDIRFTCHRPIGNQPGRYEVVRSVARDVAEMIDLVCMDSREKSLALTKLDESIFYINAAIARRG